MYLGNSDGTMPFFASVIENNLIQNTIGYNLQIKHQLSRPYIAGMPTAPTSTIIRNNVFIKDDQPSPDGDRPNAMVGGFRVDRAGVVDDRGWRGIRFRDCKGRYRKCKPVSYGFGNFGRRGQNNYGERAGFLNRHDG